VRRIKAGAVLLTGRMDIFLQARLHIVSLDDGGAPVQEIAAWVRCANGRTGQQESQVESRRGVPARSCGTRYFAAAAAYFLRNLSTRPAVSTIFCLPV